eukprot:1158739-Pelagomonas_calceolata.AAC.1
MQKQSEEEASASVCVLRCTEAVREEGSPQGTGFTDEAISQKVRLLGSPQGTRKSWNSASTKKQGQKKKKAKERAEARVNPLKGGSPGRKTSCLLPGLVRFVYHGQPHSWDMDMHRLEEQL